MTGFQRCLAIGFYQNVSKLFNFFIPYITTPLDIFIGTLFEDGFSEATWSQRKSRRLMKLFA